MEWIKCVDGGENAANRSRWFKDRKEPASVWVFSPLFGFYGTIRLVASDIQCLFSANEPAVGMKNEPRDFLDIYSPNKNAALVLDEKVRMRFVRMTSLNPVCK